MKKKKKKFPMPQLIKNTVREMTRPAVLGARTALPNAFRIATEKVQGVDQNIVYKDHRRQMKFY